MDTILISVISSIVAIFAASPALYFTVKLRLQDKTLSVLSALLFFVFFTHSLKHLSIALNHALMASIMDTVTAIFLFFYALYYWKIYRSQ
ncbi:MAG: hypothetical protein JSW11_20475 [Candidatus Heimdallarchaeota archaeon]|nr:MAG: hypothetical protein JSW11_20475 [Candidatus Heimdallarchaeota archaeon]